VTNEQIAALKVGDELTLKSGRVYRIYYAARPACQECPCGDQGRPVAYARQVKPGRAGLYGPSRPITADTKLQGEK
jgi:hypothetical protein